MGRLVASRPIKYIGLDLPLIGCIGTSIMYTSEVMRCIGDDANVYDISDKGVGIEANVEVDVLNLRYVIA